MLDLTALPKTELHLHLEGAIPPNTLLHLIHKYGDQSAVPNLAALESKLRHRNVDEFMSLYVWAVSYLREYEDFTLAARGIVHNLREKGVWYAEISVSPGMFDRFGLELQPLAKAIREGLADGKEVKTNLIIDLIRDRGPEQGDRRLSQTAEVAKEAGIVSIGIGGSEIEFPPEPFALVYRRAADLGLHRVAHAGEWVGPESVWGAVRALGVERIGHGTRSFEDPALVEYLCKARIPLEVCPTSNVCTGIVPSLNNHPLVNYFDAGVPITFSSDDPTLFHTSVVDEYNQLQTTLRMSDEKVVKIARTGFEVAFLDETERKRFLSAFDNEIARLQV